MFEKSKLPSIALNIADQAGASFADFRYQERQNNQVFVHRRALKSINDSVNSGFSVRVLIDGNWGQASGTIINNDSVAQAMKKAIATAKASAKAPKDYDVEFCPEKGNLETLQGPCEEDPFLVSNKEKADLLLDCCNRMMDQPGIVSAIGAVAAVRLHRVIANTDGSYLDLTNTFSIPMLSATAAVDGDSQSRGYQEGASQAGFEFIRKAKLAERCVEWAKDAVLKCKAEECPKGIMDLVVDPMNLSLTMHESVGHPTELDRILGWEANMAGRSFVKPEDIDNLQYGSELVNFTANNILENGVGSWFYDDDGVKLYSFPMVKNGLLVNLGMTRETAPIIGRGSSNGCCRAQNYDHFPINRIPNLYLEPGTDDSVTLDTLIADVEKGLYVEGMGSFSIDQMRNNFQFGGDMFWLIENGKITKPVKKATYQAQTTQFWNSCDGIAGPSSWRPHGVMNCGKGEPMQIMCMTHGASPARFREIMIGGASI